MKKLLITSTLLASINAMMAVPASAGVSAEEAAKLKSTLTPMGAEKAGNADGSIPAWTGEPLKAPAGHVAGSLTSIPFADEKPLFQITAANMDKYADKLTVATKHMLKTYPDFRLDVYPSHRTAVAPKFVYDGTIANATRAKLTKDGLAVEGAFHGVPFPIPKQGIELIWNHFLSWKGTTATTTYNGYTIASDGKVSLASTVDMTEQFPMYNPNSDLSKFEGVYWEHKGITTGPARSAGEALIGKFHTDFKDKDIGSWQYLPGQRRVRKVPNVSYDTPNFYSSGLTQFDEAYGFFGKPDQLDFKIVGKRELYIPYNTNKLNAAPTSQSLGPNFPKPELVRWELHRVWEVEANLKPGQRNVVPKRRMFFDEDTWNIVMVDEWDAQDRLYRGLMMYSAYSYDLPGMVALPFLIYDFQARAYAAAAMVKEYKPVPYKPASFFNPESLVQDALR